MCREETQHSFRIHYRISLAFHEEGQLVGHKKGLPFCKGTFDRNVQYHTRIHCYISARAKHVMLPCSRQETNADTADIRIKTNSYQVGGVAYD